MNTRFLLFVLLFAVISVASTQAVAAKGPSLPIPTALPIPAADHKVIRDYPLTDDVVQRLLAVAVDAKKARVELSPFSVELQATSLADITDRVLTTQPRFARIVENHGFTRREYMTARFALTSARQTSLHGADAASGAVLHNQFVSSQNASEANIAFYEAHRAELEPLMADGAALSAGQPAGRRIH